MTREQKIDAAVRKICSLDLLKWIDEFFKNDVPPGLNPKRDIEFTLVIRPFLGGVRREFARIPG